MKNAVLTERISDALILKFNRPEIRSPISVFVLNRLNEILDEVSKTSKIKKIIFTGQKDIFASGADLREIAVLSKDSAREFAVKGQRLMNKIYAFEKMTIAAVNGFCFGGALDLALSCNKRIARRNAQFSHPGVKLGIITGWGGTQRLPRLVGEATALEMFMTAKRVSANEALKIGLIDSISENLIEDALKMV
ncbi:MAG: enoyl-CoA hydratase/isomerase family protein [Pyrinomonadaceae bacterium]